MIPPVGAWQAALQLKEHGDRWAAWDAARLAADARGKPLLNIGCPRRSGLLWSGIGSYPCGDVCLDISPWRLAACRSPRPTLGDVRAMTRFADRSFGAALCCHVLEHLATVADAEAAVAELARVADVVYVCSPSRLSVSGWLHPEHALWVDHWPDGRLSFEQRVRR